MPIVLATWEAEAGVSHEPRSLRLKQTIIAPLYSILGDRARLCLYKKHQDKCFLKLVEIGKVMQNLIW